MKVRPNIGLPQKQVRINIRIPKNMNIGEKLDARFSEMIIDIGIEAKSVWETEAGLRLTTSRDRYLKALELETDYAGLCYVRLDPRDPVSQMIEKGVTKPWDMRPGFLNSPKVRLTKEGIAYRHIPMGPDKDGPFRIRTISQNSPENHWFYPRTHPNRGKGVHIRDTVVDEIRYTIIPRHVKQITDEINNGNFT